LRFIISNSSNQPIFGSNPTQEKLEYDRKVGTKKGKIVVIIEDPKLTDGEYIASILFGDSIKNYVEDLEGLSFEVSLMTSKQQPTPSINGHVLPKTTWKFERYE